MSPLRRPSGGFTLIEVVVSISVFAIITVGLTPLLVSSVRGAGLSRSYTIAKNIGSDAMEGARGLPYFVQNTQASSPQKKDLLDMYFPDLVASGTQGFQSSFTLPAPNQGTTLTNVYRTVCGPAPSLSSNPACPLETTPTTFPRSLRLPAGYTLAFYAQFVKAIPGTSSTAESYSVEPPSAGYSWTSATGSDLPPTGLLRLTVRVGWTYLGKPRSFVLTSLLGERKLASIKVQGSAQVAYTAKVLTSFVNGSEITDLNAVRGSGASSVLSRLLAGATQDVRAAEITLTRQPSVAVPSPSPIPPFLGASDFPKAPPSSNPPNVAASEGFLLHPDLSGTPPIAFLAPSTTQNMSLSVEEGLPIARGAWGFSANNEALQTGSMYERVQKTRTFWVTNQADVLPGSLLHLTDDPVFTMYPQGSGGGASHGTASTSATTTRLDSSRKVETIASASFRNICLLPTTFIESVDANAPGCVIKVSNFTSMVGCKSTAATSAPNVASATGSYSFDLSYWKDDLDDGINAGSYQTVSVSVNQSSTPANPTADLLGPIKVTNALVYDDPNPLLDVYLFPRVAGGQRGYLTDWGMLRSIPSAVTDGGRKTTVQLNGALQITTSPTNPAVEQTGMSISLGSLNCTAEDRR